MAGADIPRENPHCLRIRFNGQYVSGGADYGCGLESVISDVGADIHKGASGPQILFENVPAFGLPLARFQNGA